MAPVRTVRALSCPCCHRPVVGSAWNPKSAFREPMGVMTVCVCRLPCGGRGSCGAGMLGPHCSHSWRPKLWWPPCSSCLGLASGTQPGHLSRCGLPFSVPRRVSQESKSLPGPGLSSRWSVTEQTKERPGSGQEQGTDLVTLSLSRSLA